MAICIYIYKDQVVITLLGGCANLYGRVVLKNCNALRPKILQWAWATFLEFCFINFFISFNILFNYFASNFEEYY